MHIADGIVSTPICLAAAAVAVGGVTFLSRRLESDEIPKMGLMAAALFSASLLHVPVAGTTIHLGLFGLAGIILGRRAFPVIFTALLLQALLFQHGGLISLGLNALNMGAGALAAALVWRWPALPEQARAGLAGFSGVMIPALLMSLEFHACGYGRGVFLVLSIYLVAAGIEALLTVTMVSFFRRVGSSILEGVR